MTAPTTHTGHEPTELEACPRCGALHDPAQEYCLECGLRLPRVEGVVVTLGQAWRRRLRWYPGDWIWLALALLAIAGAGAAAAILTTRGESTQKTFVATTSPGVTTARPITPTTTAAATTASPRSSTGTTTTTQPPSPPPPKAHLIQWPSGRSGWTIVLRSLPTQRGRQAAIAEAKRAVSAGLSAGVLDSSDYASLHPGFLVVFTGVYASQAKAQAAVGSVQSHGYGGAYVRQVFP